jgi:hypothetical protein
LKNSKGYPETSGRIPHRLLRPDPEKRVTAAAVCDEPWFDGFAEGPAGDRRLLRITFDRSRASRASLGSLGDAPSPKRCGKRPSYCDRPPDSAGSPSPGRKVSWRTHGERFVNILGEGRGASFDEPDTPDPPPRDAARTRPSAYSFSDLLDGSFSSYAPGEPRSPDTPPTPRAWRLGGYH